MGSRDELDNLLASGSTRPARVEACVDESAIDDGDLLAYRRGRLGEAERESVERHLVACPFCRDLAANLHVPRRSLRWPALAGGALAAIAAAVLFFFAPVPNGRLGPYRIVSVEGHVAHQRSGSGLEGREYRPTSQVWIKIEPAHGRAAAEVRVFRLDAGVLVPVAAEIERGVGGVFIAKGSGSLFFGEEPGEKRLMIVAANELADLSGLDGRTPQAAAAIAGDVAWLPAIVVDYRTN